MELTTENLQEALRELIGSSTNKEAQPPAATPPEPQPLTFNLGGQTYTARDQDELQRLLDQAQQQQANAVEQERLRLQAAAQESAQRVNEVSRIVGQGQGQQGGFSRDVYAEKFMRDPIEAQEYLEDFSPKRRAKEHALVTKIQHMDQALQVQQFMLANRDYEPTPENFKAISAVIDQFKLPADFNGLSLAYNYVKASGALSSAQPEEREENVQPIRQGPPAAPRRARRGGGSEEADMLAQFEGLSPDKMKAFLENLPGGQTQ